MSFVFVGGTPKAGASVNSTGIKAGSSVNSSGWYSVNTGSANGGTITYTYTGSNAAYIFPDGSDDDKEEKKEKHPLAKKVKQPDGSEGMICVGCEEYSPYVEPNQDNETFKCYKCRNPIE